MHSMRWGLLTLAATIVTYFFLGVRTCRHLVVSRGVLTPDRSPVGERGERVTYHGVWPPGGAAALEARTIRCVETSMRTAAAARPSMSR